MDRKFTVRRFFLQVFLIYGVTTGMLNIFCILFGTSANGFSTIFSLGNSGVSVQTSFQFLLAAVIITVLRVLFMTDSLIKKMPLAARVIALFASVFATMVLFIFAFEWFPADVPKAWGMFIICFVVSCSVSTALSVWAEKRENRRLEDALKRCKEGA